jgi:hypothetical protein
LAVLPVAIVEQLLRLADPPRREALELGHGADNLDPHRRPAPRRRAAATRPTPFRLDLCAASLAYNSAACAHVPLDHRGDRRTRTIACRPVPRRSEEGKSVTVIERALDQAAEPWMRGHIDRAYWLWQRVNERCFAGQLSTPFIEIALPRLRLARPDRHAWADIGPGNEHGTRLEVRLNPELLRGSDPNYSRVLDDYLLHEQVHAWQVETLGWPWQADLDWHGRTFRAKQAEVDYAWSLDPAKLTR